MKKRILLKFLPRLQDIFFASIFVAVLLLGQRMLNLDGDFPRHLLTGKYILENRAVPTTELFIHPYLNQPNISHSSEWIADLIFYVLYLHAGLSGVVVLSAILIATTFGLLYSTLSKRLNLRIPVLMILAMGAIATSINWAVRPHLFSMLILAIWLMWTDNLEQGKKIPLWWFPICMLLWSNLHGEFIAGILVLIAYSTGSLVEYLLNPTSTTLSIVKNMWLALLLSMAASLINPGGVGPWIGTLGFINNGYLMSRMLEATAPNFQLPEMRVLLGLISISIFLLAINREKLSIGKGLLLAGFTAMSLIAIRNIHLYGIVAPFVLAETLLHTRNIRLIKRLEATLQNVEANITGIFWPVLSAGVLSLFVIASPIMRTFYQFDSQTFPVRAVAWLEQNPQQGKMFNELNWGGYIAFYLWPEQLTFVDSMADVTGNVTKQYETVITLADGWQDIFNQYNIQWVIFEPNSDLTKELEVNQHWKVLYEDNLTIILHK